MERCEEYQIWYTASHIKAERLEKQSIIYTPARIDEARVKAEAMENASGDREIAWNDDDTSFDLQLEKFGVDTDALTTTLIPKRRFFCWVEEWEKPFLEKNNIVSMTRLLQKYKDMMVFLCLDDDILYTAANKMLFIPPGKKDGWAVLGIPEGDDGTTEDNVCPFILRDNIVGEMVKDTDHPQESHIEVVTERPIESDASSSNSDEDSEDEEIVED